MIASRILAAIIRSVIRTERRTVAEQWNRVLPAGEYLGDRWERARFLGFGEGTSIYDSSVVIGKVIVGMNTWIGPFTVLDGSGGLKIGDNCSISAGVQIYSHETVNWATSGSQLPVDHRPTAIGSNVYIGPNVIIQGGVSIGSGAVIGANSFVRDDIPEGARAWGSPCTVQSA